MSTVTRDNFGTLIVYLVPGATALWGISQFSPALHSWFLAASPGTTSLGGFLYLTFASLAAGMTINAVRWAAIDTVHMMTGLPPPPVDFSRLGENVEAYSLLIEHRISLKFSSIPNPIRAMHNPTMSPRPSSGYPAC